MRLFLGALLASMSAPGAAESWYHVGDNAKEIIYADADSLTRTGDVTEVRALLGYTDPIDSRGAYFALSRIQFRCAAGQWLDLGYDAYGDNKNDYYYSSAPERRWQAVAGGTVADALRGFACDGNRGTPVQDPFEDAHRFMLGRFLEGR